jgi:hypothetical protein
MHCEGAFFGKVFIVTGLSKQSSWNPLVLYWIPASQILEDKGVEVLLVCAQKGRLADLQCNPGAPSHCSGAGWPVCHMKVAGDEHPASLKHIQ